MSGIEIQHVPYRGAPLAITDLMSNQVQVAFVSIITALEQVRAGTLRALAVTTAARSEALPDVPAMHEFVPGYEASAFIGIGAPRNTPANVVDALNREINAGLADPGINARLTDLGGTPLLGSAAEFGGLITSGTEKWANVIKGANIKPG